VRERFEQIKLAFERTREVDPRFVPYLVAAALVGFLVPFLISWLALGELIWGIAFGFLFAPLAAMIVFNRRVSSAQFEAMEAGRVAATASQGRVRGCLAPFHRSPLGSVTVHTPDVRWCRTDVSAGQPSCQPNRNGCCGF
jgi:hypothetical protein